MINLKKILNEATASDIIKDLDKVRHDLIKKVDVLIAKKKKLYSNVDITTPMSADEKQLDKDIQSIFSQIQDLIQQKRKIKTESVNEDKVYIDYLNKEKGFKQDRIKFNSYEEAVKWARKNFEKFNPDMIKYEAVNEDEGTTADESGMFISSITSTIESAQGIQQTIQAKGENFDVPAWVQAKTALASDYLHSINRYYKGNPDQD